MIVSKSNLASLDRNAISSRVQRQLIKMLVALYSSTSAGGLLATDLMQKIYLGCGAFMGLAVTVGFMLVAMKHLAQVATHSTAIR